MSYLRRACGVAVLLRVASAEKNCACGGSYSVPIPDDAPCECCHKDSVDNTNVVAKLGTCYDNTTVIYFKYNGALTSLPSDVLERFTELRQANFASCGLTAVPQELFKSNRKLYTVDLGSNNIGNGGLPAELFKFNLELHRVYLNTNPFTQVPAGFFANQNKLAGWSWPNDAQCEANEVSDTCESRTSSGSKGTLYYNVAPSFEHEQVVCLKKKTKVKCPTGEFFELQGAFFGRSDIFDTTCAANYKATPDHNCAANDDLLASYLQEKCNGKRTCKLTNRKQQRKAVQYNGLSKSCNPFLQVQYDCIRNVGLVQKKKQVKKARKQAKRTGDWDAFFDMLSAA